MRLVAADARSGARQAAARGAAPRLGPPTISVRASPAAAGDERQQRPTVEPPGPLHPLRVRGAGRSPRRRSRCRCVRCGRRGRVRHGQQSLPTRTAVITAAVPSGLAQRSASVGTGSQRAALPGRTPVWKSCNSPSASSTTGRPFIGGRSSVDAPRVAFARARPPGALAIEIDVVLGNGPAKGFQSLRAGRRGTGPRLKPMPLPRLPRMPRPAGTHGENAREGLGPYRSRSAANAWSTRSTVTTCTPSTPSFGLFALGMKTVLKPSFAASRMRSCPRWTGRISPANPTSPNTIDLAGRGLFFNEELMASRMAKSTAGSRMRTPPTALTKTS